LRQIFSPAPQSFGTRAGIGQALTKENLKGKPFQLCAKAM
jgi:hypothetical protein